jgi:carotenoid cleavage dioxygenase-like enzyme
MYHLYRGNNLLESIYATNSANNNMYIFIFRFIENDMNGKSRIGVMPRFGDAESIIWFDVENHCSYHLFNCFEDENEVITTKYKYTMTNIHKKHHNPNCTYENIPSLWMILITCIKDVHIFPLLSTL